MGYIKICDGCGACKVWIDKKTFQQVTSDHFMTAIELRSPGPGWRWHDAEGHRWGTGSGPNGPIWRRED